MKKGLLFVFFMLLSSHAVADSFRCGSTLVKDGDSVNMLLDKCGNPERRYNTYVDVVDKGRSYSAYVTNYVYARSGKKDMIVSVRSGVILKITPD